MFQSDLSNKARMRILLRAGLAPVVLFGLLFILAGRWDYWQAWIYIGANTLIMVLMGTVLTRSAALVEERLNPKEGMKGWDKLYFGVTTPLYVLALILGGLDARLGWTSAMPGSIYWLCFGIYLLGQAIFLWARYTNEYFSSVVRIQTDRGQTVCTTGPYHYVRHPGYFGGFLFTVTVGVLLGSWWASLPQLIAGLFLIWRTSREDRMLQAELPGYREYAAKTRYRLIPGVW